MKKSIMILLIVAAVLAVAIAGGAVYYFNKPADASGPKAVYLAMAAELGGAQNFDALFSIMKKYSKKSWIDSIDAELKDITEEEKTRVFSMFKGISPDIGDIKEKEIRQDISGDNATLSVSLKNSSAVGTIKMVREEGVWKIDSEEWEEK